MAKSLKMNGMVYLHWMVLLMVLAGVAVLGFCGGVLFVVDDSYTSAKADMLQELKAELRIAAMEGRTFFLPDSNIRFIPRADGNMNVVVQR